MLTALPMRGPLREDDLIATNWLRVQGTATLLRAAIAAGAQWIVGESFIYVYGYGDHGDYYSRYRGYYGTGTEAPANVPRPPLKLAKR